MVKEVDGMSLGAGRTSMHDTVCFVQIVEAAEDRDGDHTHHLLGDDMPLGLDLKEGLVHAVQREHHMLHIDPHLALARAARKHPASGVSSAPTAGIQSARCTADFIPCSPLKGSEKKTRVCPPPQKKKKKNH